MLSLGQFLETAGKFGSSGAMVFLLLALVGVSVTGLVLRHNGSGKSNKDIRVKFFGFELDSRDPKSDPPKDPPTIESGDEQPKT